MINSFGEIKKARSYFESVGLSAPKGVGTAEFLMESISKVIGDEATEKESTQRINEIALYAHNQAQKMEFNSSAKPIKTRNFFGINRRGRAAASVIRQFKLLLRRSLSDVFRGK